MIRTFTRSSLPARSRLADADQGPTLPGQTDHNIKPLAGLWCVTGVLVAGVEAWSGPNCRVRAHARRPSSPIEGDRLTYGFGTEPVIYRDGLELTQVELAARSECR
jgi:hypothetical protein